jgi:hypothetical protein
MGLCKDKATTYLKNLGYNVIRVPQEGIEPLQLIGRQGKAIDLLGPLNLLITHPAGSLPTITRDLSAADVNGQTSSSFSLGIGATILGNIIGAMGGNLGANVAYTDAQKMQFVFTDVVADQVVPLEVGNYLREAEVDAGNPILREYVLGNGRLFLITKTIKSDKLIVKYSKKEGIGASVDIPFLQGAVGGKVQVKWEEESSGSVTYQDQDQRKLPFGFQCFEVGVDEGDLRLTGVEAGTQYLAIGEALEASPVLLDEGGLLDMG